MTRVIAELGVNHMGDVRTALRMIREAAAAKVWGIKLQLYVPELLDARPEKRKQLRQWMLTKRELMRCRDLAHKLNLAFGASCFDNPSVALLKELGPDFQKVACGQRWPGMKWVAPLHFQSVKEKYVLPANHVIPFLCVPKYPAQLVDYFPWPYWAFPPWGISDHLATYFPHLWSRLGANYIEFHMSSGQRGEPDACVSHDVTAYMECLSPSVEPIPAPAVRTRVVLKRPIKGEKVAWLRGVDA